MEERNRLKKQRGFTLIELIVVIAILGILAAMVVPNITGFKDSAQTVADEATQRTLQSAVEMYYLDNDTYPNSIDDLKDYLDQIPKGTWKIDENGKVSGSSIAK
ncbi:competence type IV pilus major pilin ComGC [Garciella nitratireducens]|uniref:General secretion pathway protein G n=1 Tax=Garciella nitratireducens DSM 15102 TaxID=1121911 RepID=A0A1T4K5A1_9FIRM|nr:type II secretion system protein [Garciella nitratireducens]RBP46679.1 type II secretion system protein G [Garciella nitratireducens]SJZ37513.1 general secretion pathway protein G [Garciella nitratireducens DSM 15102]